MIQQDKVIEAMNKVKLLRIKQAAELLGIAAITLRRWDESGRLKAVRIGPREDRRYERKKLMELIKKGKI